MSLIEQRFPGKLTIRVTYTLSNQNHVRIDYEGTTVDRVVSVSPCLCG